MNMKLRNVLFLCAATVVLAGCDVVKQVGGAYTMTQCTYAYNSVSNLSVAGFDLSKKLSPLDLLKVAPLLTGKATSVPMSLTVGVDVSNPNKMEAMMQGMSYILSVDGFKFTSGEVNEPISVPASATKTMPLNLSFDLATLLSSDSKDAAMGIVKNLLGMSDKESKVKFEIKPSFKVGSQTLTAPNYIPLEFSL
ncbi:hypothetical protein FACS1894159_05770 [Bacteroidia bacterium]|nr:hypothetical protein FACS1894159_05770 [Bacteroidia bacterium]